MNLENLKNEVKEIEDYIIGLRRYFHENPEISGKDSKIIGIDWSRI